LEAKRAAAIEPDLTFELVLVDGFRPDPSGKFRSYLSLEQAREAAGPEDRALPHEIRLVDNEFVQSRWDEISELLTSAFKDSNFLAGFSPERPAQHTWEEMHKPDGGGLEHVVAVDSSGRVLGAIFCVRTNRPENETTSDVGWFFTDTTLPGPKRIKISDAMVERGHEELARAGYDAVVTEMGTEERARYLSKRFGYVPAPLPDKKNRWIVGLRTAAEHCVSSNSEKKAWKSAGGQLARYATADIAKDEVIIDLKGLLQRARHGAFDTLQLGEGLYYRLSEGPLCVDANRTIFANHHCSPNGYICFEDLTYRALRDVSAGDELTFNYCTTEYEMVQPFDCLCGSSNCLGRVAGCKYLDEIEVERIFSLLSPFLKSKV